MSSTAASASTPPSSSSNVQSAPPPPPPSAVDLIADGLSAVTEGCRLPVRMHGQKDEWPKAEVISIRRAPGSGAAQASADAGGSGGSEGEMQYYVHYVDYNKRLDEWVTEDRLDTRRIEPPTSKLDERGTTGVNTPKRTAAATATPSAAPTATPSR